MSLDPAIVQALSLDTAASRVELHGSSGFTSTAKITTTINGLPKELFMKTGSSAEMFSSKVGKLSPFFLGNRIYKKREPPQKRTDWLIDCWNDAGEHASLNAIHAAVPSLCPESLAYGQLAQSKESFFLVTEFLDLHARSSKEPGSGLSLARKLAQLHSTPSPIPWGQSKPAFGFPVTTFCGSTPQDNTYKTSWAEFYAENRLRAVGRLIREKHGRDDQLHSLIEQTAREIVPTFLGDGHLGGAEGIVPVLVHGDLWSGNKSRGTIGGKGGVEDVAFDPSSCYAHSEYELGIMSMFGGFSAGFFDEYHRLIPKTEPEEEYEDRVMLYEL